MQGRANKAKKELVIESPQQYKNAPITEVEEDAVSQVGILQILMYLCGAELFF